MALWAGFVLTWLTGAVLVFWRDLEPAPVVTRRIVALSPDETLR
jgi:hypothetical protein